MQFRIKISFTSRTDFSNNFRKIIVRHKRIGYDLNVMRQSASLAFKPITVDIFAALFNSTPVDRAIDFSRLGPELSSVVWSTGA